MTFPLYGQDVMRRILCLREDLIRHDENLAAWHLMSECVPYFCRDHPAIREIREQTRQMVEHVLDEEGAERYRNYYATNVHERPFEDQYGISPDVAHEHMHRIRWLRGRLDVLATELDSGRTGPIRLLDLGANDGFMAANLDSIDVPLVVDCVDLHPGNCEGARKRKDDGAPIGDVFQDDAVAVASPRANAYDAVVAFEIIEHVRDPDELLAAMVHACKPGGRMYVSTPIEAMELGMLDNWSDIEPKGHVRVITPPELHTLAAKYGRVTAAEVGSDRVAVCEIKP